jgi:16S rRNA (adenine1518-N6/adenine1519-N6)-dimethyltransferase
LKTNNRYDIVAKKRFGQNFLQDEQVLEEIIESIPNNQHMIVEIGTGLGDLTKRLLSLDRDVKSYEIDNRLHAIIRDKFSYALDSGALELVLTDVLSCWQDSVCLEDRSYDLVANLPYNVATKIILKALLDDNCKTILVMIQKEVAKKFCASVGDREFSSLSLLAESYGDKKLLFEVPPEAFTPQPKVDSAVIIITKEPNKRPKSNFWMFIKDAFVQPRKRLLKNLAKHIDAKKLLDIFSTLKLSINIRPHEVDLSTYNQIFNIIEDIYENRREDRDSTKRG